MLPIIVAAAPPSAEAAYVERDSRVADGCSSELVARAVDEARRKFPISPEPGRALMERGAYIARNMWRLFDPEGKGYLDYKRYADYEWASIQARFESDVCKMSFEDYLYLVNGPYVQAHREHEPGYEISGRDSFRRLDRGQKGYLTRDDFDVLFRGSFRGNDRNRDGRLTPEEYLINQR